MLRYPVAAPLLWLDVLVLRLKKSDSARALRVNYVNQHRRHLLICSAACLSLGSVDFADMLGWSGLTSDVSPGACPCGQSSRGERIEFTPPAAAVAATVRPPPPFRRRLFLSTLRLYQNTG